jgi:hypothetical protein
MKRYAWLFIILFLFPSCGRLKGEFAFQEPDDKCYRTNQGRLEFDSAQEIKWVYKFESVPSSRVNLGIIILKKELSWVDIITTSDYIDPMKGIIYGTLKELEPGDYKIVITQITIDGNQKIDEKEVYLYSDEEDMD